MRHSALMRVSTTLHVVYIRAGDTPEAILYATVT
jgi:hypothetical protein